MDGFWAVLILCTVAGVLLGLFYFASLWWVARRLPQISRPALWVPLSTLARMLVVLVVVYLLMDHRWERLVAVMLGFLIGRFVVFWQVGVLRTRSERV
jgi:F1F0 ATPase subunit 2